ncbi:outer membrane beta-barrel protein [Dysgonomonas reticulitermitis]
MVTVVEAKEWRIPFITNNLLYNVGDIAFYEESIFDHQYAGLQNDIPKSDKKISERNEEFEKSKVSIGIKSGFNLTDKKGDKNWDSKFGFRLGMHADYVISDFLFLRTGATYSQKGAEYKNDFKKLDYNIQYLTIPVGIGVFIPFSEKLNLSLIFSGYTDIGLFVDSKVKENQQEIFFSSSWNASNLKQTDIGVSVDAELSYNQILFNVGYERGLKNISLKQNNNLFRKWNSDCLYLTVGYKFLIK